MQNSLMSQWTQTYLVIAILLSWQTGVNAQAKQSEQSTKLVVSLNRTGEVVPTVPYIGNIRNFGNPTLCLAVLITELLALTSGTCVDPLANFEKNPVIVFNDTNTETSDESEVFRMVAETFYHPNYTGNARDGYNLAILKLNESTTLMPVRTLPPSVQPDLIGRQLKFMTFGRTTDEGGINPLLQAFQLNIVEPSKCENIFEDYIPDQMFCVDEAVACTQDTGGVGLAGNDLLAPILMGINSGTRCYPTIPFTGMTSVVTQEIEQWIEDMINELNPFEDDFIDTFPEGTFVPIVEAEDAAEAEASMPIVLGSMNGDIYDYLEEDYRIYS